MAQVRIAIAKATGRKYIIQKLEFPLKGEATALCWGEVYSYKWNKATKQVLKTGHFESKTFLKSEVEVVEVARDLTLLQELFAQGKVALANDEIAGWTKADIEARRKSNQKLNEIALEIARELGIKF